MTRPRAAVLAVAAALAGALLPAASGASGGGACEGVSPLDPSGAVNRVLPQPAGTERTYCIFFGPYTIPPGHDVSRLDTELSLSDGFLVAGGPSVVRADGSEPSHQAMHIHHAHWWFLDPEAENHGPEVPFPGWKWIAGSGEEETEGDFGLVADAAPGGPRYGLAVRRGERVLLINMLHNKTATPFVIWIRVDLTYVHGTAAEILAETGEEYRNLTPVLVGDTFDVPRDGPGGDGELVHPHDRAGSPPGVVWESPFSGTIVIGAAHMHPGGLRAIVTNLGRADSPCAGDRTDGIPGKTLYELDAITRDGVPFSEEFQIEITQPGFRAAVRQGDRIALNGVYESAEHAWWDAMVHTGFFVDERPVGDAEACQAGVVGVPASWTPPLGAAIPSTYSEGVPNREWSGDADPACGLPGKPACDRNLPPAPAGPRASEVAITAFKFLPGGQGLPGALGPPQVPRGTALRFGNTDFMTALIRHTVTSCASPCDGEYVTNYPLPDGAFDSGFLGYEPTTGGGVPYWSLDTAGLGTGRYTYFCRIHPWMRGAFDIV